MKKTSVILALLLTPLTSNSLENEKSSEKNINPNIQKEIHDYDVKRREINNECKLKRKVIHDKLSFEAQKVLHEKRQKRLPAKSDIKKS